MESSRIFVRGLPPNLTAEDFRKHFSKQAAITDARFVPHRRIGYVGYKSHEDAAKAVKYHHKSFIRMSRIGVELARSIEEQYALKPQRNTASGSKVVRTNVQADANPENVNIGKRKREDGPDGRGAAKLQEFLEVMQPPSKSRIWANEDSEKAQVTSKPIQDAELQVIEAGESDKEYEHVPKKRKEIQKPEQGNGSEQQIVEVATASKEPTAAIETGDRAAGPDPVSQEVSRPSEAVFPSASDKDWLRSRTSRLLGLVDDDDAIGSKTLLNDDDSKKPEKIVVAEQLDRRKMSDASIQTDEEPKVQPPVVENFEGGTGRLFVRNLSYTTTEDDIRKHFEFQDYGPIDEVHLPIDYRSGTSKGFAYVQYTEPDAADQALNSLDGKPFQGRLLHIIPAKAKKQTGLDEFAISKLPLKKQQQIKRKAEAASSTFNWNAMYMNTDAVMSSISDRLGISKSELLDPTSSDAAIKQAHAETHIIQETKAYFTANGVNLNAFKKRERGDSTILVKNFSYGTESGELRKLFEVHGPITRILMPPSGMIAIVEFEQANHARSAFGSLAYRKFKDSILFLEKAPRDLFDGGDVQPAQQDANVARTSEPKHSATDLLDDTAQQFGNTSTLFVRNLNFSTTTDRLREVFQPLEGFMSARVKTKSDPNKPGQLLSMGFGFLEFQSKPQAQAAVAVMDGYKLDGHDLLIKASHKAIDAAEERRREDYAKKVAGRMTKIIIKNLPFEVSKKDVRSLFGSYGQLRSVRVPKRFDSSTRGFAFADFVTAREAENAMNALKDTHLLGRRLVLDFAAEDAVDPEQEIEKMQKKVGSQADKVALQRLTGSGRKKFNVQGSEELDLD